MTIWERYALAGREFCAGGLPAARHSVHDRMIEWIELYETNQLVGDIRGSKYLFKMYFGYDLRGLITFRDSAWIRKDVLI